MKKLLEAALRFGNTNLLENFSAEDLNSIDSDGTSVLMYAIKNCSFKICEYLINNGADIYYESCLNETALTLAKELKKDAVVNLIQNKINQDNLNLSTSQNESKEIESCSDDSEPFFFDYIDDFDINQDSSIVAETISKNKEIYSSTPIDNSLDLDLDLSLESDDYYKNLILNETEYYLSKQIVQKILNNALENNGITGQRVIETLHRLKYTNRIKSSLLRVLEEHDLLTEDPFFDEATSFYFFDQITYKDQVEQLYVEYLDHFDKWNSKDFLSQYQKRLKSISHEETIALAKKRDLFVWDLYSLFKTKCVSLKDTLINYLTEKEHKNIENLFSLLERMPSKFDVAFLYQIMSKESFGLGSFIECQYIFHDFFLRQGLNKTYDVIFKNIKETLYAIVAGNWRLIPNFIAKKAAMFPMFYEDIFLAGEMGLHKAAAMYQVNKDIRFSTYASFWIRAETGKFIKNNSFQIRIPVHVYDELTSTNDQFNYLDWQSLNIEYRSLRPIIPILNYEKCNKEYSHPIPLVQINIANCISEVESRFLDYIIYDDDPYDDIHKNEIKKTIYDCLSSERFSDKERYILYKGSSIN